MGMEIGDVEWKHGYVEYGSTSDIPIYTLQVVV